MLALVADSEKLDRVSSYSMRGKFFCPADDIQLKSHWKIGHRLALLTDKMIMKSRYSVIAFDAVSKISAFDAPFFDQYPHVAVNVSQADRWNFFSKNIVHSLGSRVRPVFGYDFKDSFTLYALSSLTGHVNNDS